MGRCDIDPREKIGAIGGFTLPAVDDGVGDARSKYRQQGIR